MAYSRTSASRGWSATTSEYMVTSNSLSRPATGRTSTERPRTRARTATSTLGGSEQQIICAVTESRGIAPTVGLAFVNLSTAEAVLCQIVDNQTYRRTLHKLNVFDPTEILIPAAAIAPTKSKLYQLLETSLNCSPLVTPLGRRYWDEIKGVEYIQHLAFMEDVEAITVSIGGNFFATCCLAAVCLKTNSDSNLRAVH